MILLNMSGMQFREASTILTDRDTDRRLVWEGIDSDGRLGDPYYGYTFAFIGHPQPVRILVSLDGNTVIDGSGMVFDGDNLSPVGSLDGPIVDGYITNEKVYNLQNVSGKSQVQKWNLSFQLEKTSPELYGTPLRLIPFSQGMLLISIHNGNTRISILDNNLNIVATPPVIGNILANPTNGDAPLVVAFGSEITFGSLLSYQWIFGDGQTGSGANPTHTYNHSGNYSVKLVVSNSNGLDVFNVTDLISVNPTLAEFVAAPNKRPRPLQVHFTNLTNGTVFDSIHRDFGDGGTSTDKDPIHTYSEPGNYTVTLTMDGPGGTSTIEKVDHIQVQWPTFFPIVMYQFNVYTRPGTYPFNRCATFPVLANGPVVANMTECVQSVIAQEDGQLKFIYSWRATYFDLDHDCLIKYSDVDNHNMYISNQDGMVSHFTDAGGSAGYISCMANNYTYTGWFLFPRALTQSTVYTFYDQDNHIALSNLQIPLK